MKIVLLELVCKYAVDIVDGEAIEDRLEYGYYLNLQICDEAYKNIFQDLNKGWEIEKKVFDISMSSRQKYLYVLKYEYKLGEDTFYYSFPPCTSREKCKEQKIELLKNKKYQHADEKEYLNNHYGWQIEKVEIIK